LECRINRMRILDCGLRKQTNADCGFQIADCGIEIHNANSARFSLCKTVEIAQLCGLYLNLQRNQ